MLLLYYYYIIIIFLLENNYNVIMSLFLGKKVTKKTKILAMPLCAKDVSLHYLVSYINYTPPARIFISLEHTHYTSFYVQHYFSIAFYLFF